MTSTARPVRDLLGLPVAPVVAVVLVLGTGAAAAAVDGLPDPGVAVRWGLPAVKAVRDVAAAATVGLLLVAAALLPGRRGRAPTVTALQRHTLRLGAQAGTLWTIAGLVLLVLTYADLAGLPATSPEVLAGVPLFAVDFELGRPLALSVGLSAAAALVAALSWRLNVAGFAAALSLAGVLPLAWTGHAAGTANHGTAVDAQAFHLAGVSVWLGGLIALTLIRRRAGADFPVLLRRYSTLAGWCYGLVVVSGVIAASVRLTSWPSLVTTDYGRLVLAKVAALTLLGLAGWAHRRMLLRRPGHALSATVFARLAAAEILLMGVAVGIAVALSRTPPPTGSSAAETPAEALLGYPMPPPLDATTVFTAWRIDPLWLSACLVGSLWYLRAVHQLRRRGDRWPWPRTAAFVTGMILLVAATNGSPGVYGQVLFSMHMVQHMTVATAVPVFVALAAPVTLALRTLPSRSDHSRGPREWLLTLVHSRASRILSHALVAAPLFIGSLVVFYYSAAFQLSLSTHLGHVLMMIHFLLTGYLFANVICGIDPGPARPPYPFRLILLVVTFSFHAFFAVSMMAGSAVLAEEWYRQLPRSWGRSLAAEQTLGASLSWALGDYPVGILGIALVTSWIRADARDARRHDRQAARDDDAELSAYNTYLGGLGSPTGHRQPTGTADGS